MDYRIFKLIQLTIVITAALFLFSCKSRNQDKLVFEEVPDEELQAIIQEFPTDTFGIVKSKGAIWKTWESLHKECLQNEFFRNPAYLGISNKTDIGSLYDKSGDFIIWDVDKLFSEAEKAKFVSQGQPQPCSYTQKLKVSIEGMISTSIPSSGVDAELSAALNTSKDVSAVIDNWQLNKIVSRELQSILNGTDDAKKLQYKSDLIEKRSYIVSQCAKINGFSATINLEKEMSAELKAKLESGYVTNIGNSEAKLKFKYENSKTIKVVSEGSFIVFVELLKAKRVS